MILLLLACVSPAPPTAEPVPTDPPPGDDTAALPDDTAGDTGQTVLLSYACPEGMAPIPTDSPAYCIDRYEVTVRDALAQGLTGEIPTVGITYEEAAALCDATPALDDRGEPYGYLRIATNSEWEDAGDGVVGAGGSVYPWGDEYDDTRCATPRDDGTLQYEELQPTGSLPGCVSAFGVYDLVGNAWEWTDSGRLIDAATSLAELDRAGLTLEETDEGLRLTGGSSSMLFVDAAGLQPPTVSSDADGSLYVAASQVQPDPDTWFGRGYLVNAETRLAVRFTRIAEGDDAPWRVFVAREYEGRTLPDKRGCAYYTGTNQACALASASLAHLPDFDGTIGFRCVAAPYPVTRAPVE